jgi:hypothetical protein
MDAIEEKIYLLAKPYLITRDNDIHTQIAVDCALRLLETGKGDRRVVLPAIILHDVGWFRVPEAILPLAFGPKADMSLNRIHEEEGVKIATSILREVGYDSSQVAEILQIIDGHDTRADAISVNDEVVRDADKLSRYTESEFWSMVKKFKRTPEETLRALELLVERWFFMPVSREMAREELKQRRQEIEALRLEVQGLPQPGTADGKKP